MGGLIGQWLAIHAGRRITRLILCNTAAKIGTETVWDARIELVRQVGMQGIASAAIERWFTPEFVLAEPAQVEAVRQQLIGCDPHGYAASCAAVRDADFRDRLGEIAMPLLVIAGRRDPVTTVSDGEVFTSVVPRSHLVALEAAHLSNINARAEFNLALLEFLGAG